MTKDWRLQHLETQPYLRGVSFVRKPYRAPRPRWDHDHCVACWAKLAEPGYLENPDIVPEGYATTAEFVRGADYDWVCSECFHQFRELMEWKEVRPPTEAAIGDIQLLKIYVDFNLQEGPRTIVIPPRQMPINGLTVGTKVILCEPGDIECEAIVRPGATWEWVADIVQGTIRETSLKELQISPGRSDMDLRPEETDLVGKWISDGDSVIRDPVDTRIIRLIEGPLEKIAVSPEFGAWEVLYRDPRDERYWEVTYPNGGHHGGGPRRLTIIDAKNAKAKYRL
jgi:hypothetical protein